MAVEDDHERIGIRRGGPLNSAQKRFPKAKVFTDWRVLMEDPGIDGVVISTADHHHALAAVAAMRAGKHVYCEKPLAHTVREARVMAIIRCQPLIFGGPVFYLPRASRRVEEIGEIQPLSCGLSLYIVYIESGCLSVLGMVLGI